MNKADLEFNKNEDQMKQFISQLRAREKKARQGGGDCRAAALRDEVGKRDDPLAAARA